MAVVLSRAKWPVKPVRVCDADPHYSGTCRRGSGDKPTRKAQPHTAAVEGNFQGIWLCFSGGSVQYNDQGASPGRIPGNLVLFRSATVVLIVGMQQNICQGRKSRRSPLGVEADTGSTTLHGLTWAEKAEEPARG